MSTSKWNSTFAAEKEQVSKNEEMAQTYYNQETYLDSVIDDVVLFTTIIISGNDLIHLGLDLG